MELQKKLTDGLIKYINEGFRFGLIRRNESELKNGKIEEYFKDVDFKTISKGKYDGISLYKGRLYMTTFDSETLKSKRSNEWVGYVFPLSLEQNFAGGSYLDISDLIFEEFMSRKIYLKDEPQKLWNLYCTIDRKRGTTRMWLLGNTISRVCPYLKEWGIDGLLRRMKQGEIVKHIMKQDNNGEIEEIPILIEYCRATGQSSHTFGSHAGMLNTGEWQSDPQPHIEESKKNYDVLYRIIFQYSNFKFIGEFLQNKKDKNKLIWFIYPKYTEITDDIIVFSDVVKSSNLWNRNIYNCQNNKFLNKIFSYFTESNIFYSDDLTGTDFKQAIDFEIRK